MRTPIVTLNRLAAILLLAAGLCACSDDDHGDEAAPPPATNPFAGTWLLIRPGTDEGVHIEFAEDGTWRTSGAAFKLAVLDDAPRPENARGTYGVAGDTASGPMTSSDGGPGSIEATLADGVLSVVFTFSSYKPPVQVAYASFTP